MKNDFLYNRRGEPVFVAGLQCHNSSSGTPMIEETIETIKLYGGNLLEAPVYWCEVEKEEGVYDMSLVASLVDKVRDAGLYLIPLWFGASKNGMYTYAPDYIKKNPKKYKRVRDFAGLPVESLSPHCRETLERDKAAFSRVMEFLEEYDKDGCILAVQVENEVGVVWTDRDYSEEAEREYRQPVPEYLRDIQLKDTGIEKLSEIVENSWVKVFGRHANEAFSAWKQAEYIREMVLAGLEKYKIPYIMNVSIEVNLYEEPGSGYVSGGPVSRVLDIWKKTTPEISFFGPDIYLQSERDYKKACEVYAREDNPLFIPESSNAGMGPALWMMYAAAEYGAIGVCCFGAESAVCDGKLLPEAEKVALSMRILSSIAPLLIRYRKTGRVHSIIQTEFSEWQYIKTEDYHIIVRFISNNPKPQHYFGSRIHVNAPGQENYLEERGRGILVDCGNGEFYIAGAGLCLSFVRIPEPDDEIPYAHRTSRVASQLHFLSVEEGHFEGERWISEYQRNGDEAEYQTYVHSGSVVRIKLNQEMGWKEII